MEKRKAAKEVFIQQQIQDEMDEFTPNVEPDPSDDQLYDSSPVSPPPAPRSSPSSKPSFSSKKQKNYVPNLDIISSEEMQLEKDPISVRINGFWIWKRVIVPPNAYVVHTRLNKKEPVTLGLGVSFRYNPYKDAFLIIPAAMQTIGVVANCISKEKQGINVLAYVQWQIDDFSVAYKKLDLTNSRDPLGIVNAQLREQAEAAIKDKIATMSVEDVLTDKALIIEELTSRLSRVAEGQEGLGIRIITVQIREAVVSSSTLWNDLQSPFRNEQRKKARISQLEMEIEINKKELETRKWKETREAETNFEIEDTKQKKYTETVELRLKQEALRYEEEQKSIQKKKIMEEETNRKLRETEDSMIAHREELFLKQELEELKRAAKREEESEKVRLEAEKRKILLEIERKLFEGKEQERLQLEEQVLQLSRLDREMDLEERKGQLAQVLERHSRAISILELESEQKRKEIQLFIQEKENELKLRWERSMLEIARIEQEIANTLQPHRLTKELIDKLPEIAEHLPKPDELRIFQSNNTDPLFDSLSSFLQKAMSLTQFIQEKK
jgi:flotillin